MKSKFKLSILFFIMIIAISSCAKSSEKNEDYPIENKATMEMAKAAGGDYNVAAFEEFTSVVDTKNLSESDKIIVRASVGIRSDDLDTLIDEIKNDVKEKAGYLENSSVRADEDGKTIGSNIIARIPRDKYEEFIRGISKKGNIVFLDEYSENISIQYNDLETQIKSAEVAKQRLLDLLKDASNVSDLISIQEQLDQKINQYEYLMSQKNNFDNDLKYNTVDISVSKNKVYVDSADKSFIERVKSTLKYSLNTIKSTGVTFIVMFLGGLPLIIYGIIVLLIALTIIGLFVRFMMFIIGIKKRFKN